MPSTTLRQPPAYTSPSSEEVTWKSVIGVQHSVKSTASGVIYDAYRFPLPEETDTDFSIPVYCNGSLGLPLDMCSFDGPTDVTPRYRPAANVYIAEGVDHAGTVLDTYFRHGLVVYQRGSFRYRDPVIVRKVPTNGPDFTFAHLLTLLAHEQHRHHTNVNRRAAGNTNDTFDARRQAETPPYEATYIVAVRRRFCAKEGIRWFPELEVRMHRSAKVEKMR
ncbi:hypothetical protein C8T65DRAFT_672599 [Cerioporus squamosus]|nr:hypothetical protein C8T65DRAFT_672599 [Cerioporus squamosus]